MENYFEALKLSIDEIQGQNETTIKTRVEAAHTKEFARTVGPYVMVPRRDRRTQAQWQVILDNAKKALLDPKSRAEHIAEILGKDDNDDSVRRVAISCFSLAVITLVTRLIIQQFGTFGWLATQLTGTGFINWEQHWQWIEWFEWPWFEWTVYTLRDPGSGLGFVIALASLGVGIFAYWYFCFRKKRLNP